MPLEQTKDIQDAMVAGAAQWQNDRAKLAHRGASNVLIGSAIGFALERAYPAIGAGALALGVGALGNIQPGKKVSVPPWLVPQCGKLEARERRVQKVIVLCESLQKLCGKSLSKPLCFDLVLP